MWRRTSGLSVLLLLGVIAEAALGCRYNVRETGFVDLGLERYFLFCFTGEDDDTAAEGTAAEVLRDSRVAFEAVSPSAREGHPASKYLEAVNGASRPAFVMVSPSESVHVIDDMEALEMAVASPLMKKIAENLAGAYGVVLLVEGDDDSANAKAREAAESAIEEIEKQLPYMPKPIERGPALLTLRRESVAGERTLLWSLGLEDESFAEPRAAVLYGRARWIGPLLKGDEITGRALYGFLALVGADCECGLDPTLLRGVGLPVRWGRDAQAVVARDLGFDPENPMVKTEVSQILHMQSAIYPWNVTAREDRAHVVDDLPVPFVEDTEVDSGFAWTSALLTFAGMAVAALLAAAFLLLRARRRKS